MATWTRSTSYPITTEREVLVYDPETGRVGWASVRWVGPARTVEIFGAVVHLDRVRDEHGTEIDEPRVTVLDRDPTFI